MLNLYEMRGPDNWAHGGLATPSAGSERSALPPCYPGSPARHLTDRPDSAAGGQPGQRNHGALDWSVPAVFWKSPEEVFLARTEIARRGGTSHLPSQLCERTMRRQSGDLPPHSTSCIIETSVKVSSNDTTLTLRE